MLLLDRDDVYWDSKYGVAYIREENREAARATYNYYHQKREKLKPHGITIKKKNNFIFFGYQTPGKFPDRRDSVFDRCSHEKISKLLGPLISKEIKEKAIEDESLQDRDKMYFDTAQGVFFIESEKYGAKSLISSYKYRFCNISLKETPSLSCAQRIINEKSYILIGIREEEKVSNTVVFKKSDKNTLLKLIKLYGYFPDKYKSLPEDEIKLQDVKYSGPQV